MGKLALAIGGAAIGAAFPVVGANIGFLAGSLLGQVLFPTVIRNQGPDLGDLNLTGSNYGRTISRGWGTNRYSSNMMWGKSVIETIETSSGGKGLLGPKVIQSRQVRVMSWASLFCAGPQDDVLKIWFDNKLVFDKTGQNAFTKEGLVFRFYSGDETQLPDPAWEADKGVDNVSANRGLCYIVFEDYNTEDHGNRPPKIEALITSNAQKADSVQFSDDITVAEGGLFDQTHLTETLAFDYNRRLIYVIGTTGSEFGHPAGIRVYNMDTLQEIRQVLETDILEDGGTIDLSGTNLFSVGADTGYIYAQAEASPQPFLKIDPDSLKEVGRLNPGAAAHTNIQYPTEITALRAGPNVHFLLFADYSFGGHNRFGIINADDMTGLLPSSSTLFHPPSGEPRVMRICAGVPEMQFATGWMTKQQNGQATQDLLIYKVTVRADARPLSDGFPFGVEVTLMDTIDPAIWGGTNVNADIVGPMLDEVDGGLVFVVDESATGGDFSTAFKWREGEGVVWATSLAWRTPIGIDGTSAHAYNKIEGQLLVGGPGSLVGMIDTVTGEIIVNGDDAALFTGGTGYNVGGQQFMDPVTNSIISLQTGGTPSWLGQVFLQRSTGLGVADSVIISEIGADVGYDPATEFDVTELTDLEAGFKISQQGSSRQAIELLMIARQFDAVESDYIIKFVKRGQDPVRTILKSNLVPVSTETWVAVPETITEETDLPETITVNFVDPDIDYQTNTMTANRITQPKPAVRTLAKPTLSLPITMTATEAKQLAEKILFTSWNERFGNRFIMAQEHLDLDPTDVVNIDLENGTILRSRLTDASVGINYTVEADAVRQDKTSYVSTTTSDGALGVPQQLPPPSGLTRLFMLDMPNLRDQDDTGGVSSRLPFAMAGFQLGWGGATLWDSPDGMTFEGTGAASYSEVTYGSTATALPATATPHQVDSLTQLQVFLTKGSISSVTQSQFEQDQNAALVWNSALLAWEIITFRDASLQSDGSYIISTMTRGRRGTDIFTEGHAIGDIFILLSTTTVQSFVMDLSRLNTGRFYKGVSVAGSVEDALIVGLTHTGSDLKPYAAVTLAAALDGGSNIDLSWVRRTRVGGPLANFTGVIPLAEETESYEVDIKTGPDGVVQRTLAPTTPAVQYDAADTITDWDAIAAILVPGDTDANDDSNNAATGTLGSEAAVQTMVKKYGAGSIEFSPTAFITPSQAQLTYPDIPAYTLGTGDFTIEGWLRLKSLTNTFITMASHYLDAGNQRGWILRTRDDSTAIQFIYHTDGTAAAIKSIYRAFAFAIDTQYHVAIVRRGTEMRLFVGGARQGDTFYAGTDNIHDSTQVLMLGNTTVSSGDHPLDGFVDDFRMVAGTAMYWDDFEPPAQSLLTRDQVTFEVFQMSAAVGRGFGREATIMV